MRHFPNPFGDYDPAEGTVAPFDKEQAKAQIGDIVNKIDAGTEAMMTR